MMDQITKSHPTKLFHVSDEFIAFIYAAGVHLFIDKAHEGELFHYFWLSVVVFLSIIFYAQDWLSRFGGFRRIEGIRPSVFYGKTILDVIIAVCLCLIILDAIGQMDNAKALPSLEKSFYIKVFAFAFFAGIWNIVVIFTVVAKDEDISRQDIFSFLHTGHISKEILSLFPKVDARLKEMERWFDDYLKANQDSSEALQIEKNLGKHFWRFFKSSLHLFFRLNVVGPLRLIGLTLMSWIGLHLLFLNLAIGILILLSSVIFEGKSIIHIKSPILLGCVLVVIVWLSSRFRTAYFSRGNKIYEIIGYAIFWTFLLGFYLSLSARWLALTLALQQLAANVFIFNFLLVPANHDKSSNGLIAGAGGL